MRKRKYRMDELLLSKRLNDDGSLRLSTYPHDDSTKVVAPFPLLRCWWINVVPALTNRQEEGTAFRTVGVGHSEAVAGAGYEDAT